MGCSSVISEYHVLFFEINILFKKAKKKKKKKKKKVQMADDTAHFCIHCIKTLYF